MQVHSVYNRAPLSANTDELYAPQAPQKRPQDSRLATIDPKEAVQVLYQNRAYASTFSLSFRRFGSFQDLIAP